MLQRFSSRSPSCVLYDEKLNFYSSIGQEIAAQPMSREVKFALLHLDPLARALQVSSRGNLASSSGFPAFLAAT